MNINHKRTYMKYLVPFFLFLSIVLEAQVVDSIQLNKMSLTQLYSLFKSQNKPEEQLPFALAMLQKGEKELDTQDTAYARILFIVGGCYYKIGKNEEAKKYLSNSIKIWEHKEPLYPIYAGCLNSLGNLYSDMGDYKSAESLYLKSLEIRKKALGEMHPEYAGSLNNLGILYSDMGNYESAEPLYKKSLEIYKKALGEMHPDYALSLNNLGNLYYRMGDYKSAEPLYKQTLEIKKKALGEEHLDIANCFISLGNLYFDMGDYKSAEPLYKQTLEIKKKALGEEHPDIANCLISLGNLYFTMGDYKSAEPLYKQTLEILKKALGEEHPDVAMSLNNLGNLFFRMGDYKSAEPLYKKSLEILKKALGEDHPDVANSLGDLGNLYSEMGDYKSAEPLLKKSLGILKKALGEEHLDLGNNLNNLGNLYSEMGDYKLAEPLYKQTLEIYKKALGEEHPDVASSLGNLGNLYSDMGDYKSAEPLYKQTLEILKKAIGEEHPNVANNLNNLGVLYMDMGDYKSAELLYKQSLEILKKALGEEHPNVASSLINLGILYRDMGEYKSAEPLYKKAIEIYKKAIGEEHPDYVNSLFNLGILHKKMYDYPKAVSYCSQCYNIKNKNLSKNFSWLSEKGKANYWVQEKGFYEELNNFAAMAVESYPKSSEISYNSNLIAKGLLLESYREIEEAVQNSNDTTTNKIFKDLKEMRRLISHLVSTGTGNQEIIDRYEQESDSLDKILVGRLGEYAASKRKFQINWKDVQNALSDKYAAIEFARYFNEKDSQHYYMALVLRQGYTYPKLAKLGAEKSILAAANEFNFPELYKLVWEPLDSFLNGVETVYYSPDGYLNNIAFSALCGNGSITTSTSSDVASRGAIRKKTKQTKDCVYLSDRYSLHQLSTTRYLAEGLKSSNMENSMLLVGGVNYDEIPTAKDTLAEEQTDMEDYALAENIARSSTNQNRMEYLPGTKTELQSLQKILNKKHWKIRAYSDKNASENIFKSEVQKESPGILHIATHGFAYPDIQEKKKGFGEESKTYRDSDNPMVRCGLMLAGANYSWTAKPDTMLSKTGEDGILTALEFSQLNLRKTKLVVLSACETGLGKIEGSEGTFGLKRGFKLAGVEQIIVSLWSVPDKETMELMTLFYNDLSKTKNR